MKNMSTAPVAGMTTKMAYTNNPSFSQPPSNMLIPMVVELAIYDTMQFVTCDVNTYCMGMAASMGAFLLCAGTKGKRFALPNSDIMIHQVSGGAHGTASDVERSVEFMYKLNRRLIRIIAENTGKSEDQVKKDADRDYYMTAQEAQEYGLVDEVVKYRKELKNPPEKSPDSKE